MQEQKRETKLAKGQQLVKCSSCSRVFDMDKIKFSSIPLHNTERETQEGATEVGIVCPGCNTWTRSYFLNDELRKMQIDNPNRKHRRTYAVKFRKYQRVMKRKYDSIPNQGNQSQENENQPSPANNAQRIEKSRTNS